MCAKEIGCLLTLGEKLVVGGRNEALDSSLQRKIDANFLTWDVVDNSICWDVTV